jgi:eukaryotic-like serine/threonine-protein kinase
MHTTEQLNTALDGRYVIERRVGAGGMAVVYLARDLKHQRLVALKVLNPELGAVLGPERFMSEIQVMANLHHPNLLPLFDSGEAGGLLFYVMPFIEGETLRERLVRERQLGVDESIRIAAAIASALDYAHRHDVIHRDLKPENILMHEGQPLVMDFGIALAVSKAGGARITQTGLSLGTPQYMSPEQATGDHALDARTDIYSLGAVLYEMLVGDPPHTGSTVQAVIAKVITEPPRSVRATRSTVPEPIEAAVMTALAKIPADRFDSAADFAAALTGRKSVSMPGGMRTSAALSGTGSNAKPFGIGLREIAAWTTAMAAVLTIVWLAARTPSSASPQLAQFDAVLPDSLGLSNLALGNRVAISRDGSLLVFSVKTRLSPRALFVRSADNSVSSIVNGADGSSYPTFSPDKKWILYDAPARLMKIPVTGGTPVTLATTNTGLLRASSWGDDDRIVYSAGSDLWITNAEGDTPRLLAAADTARGIRGLGQPEILPGSKYALITLQRGKATPSDPWELAVISLKDGSIAPLKLRGYAPHFAAPGFVVFAAQTDMVYAAPFSPTRRVITGPAIRILDHVMTDLATMSLSVAENGWMLYASSSAAPITKLVVVDQQGGERILPFEPRSYAEPEISPDGRRLALRVSSGAFNSGNIWIHDLQNGSMSRLTSDSVSYRPMWSRDGLRVLYVNGKNANTRVVSRPWDGSGAESVLLTRGSLAEVTPGVAGGLSAIRTLDGPRDIYLAPGDSLAALKPFVMGPADETNPRISPDGKWLAYQSNETGPPEVYVRPIPGPGGRLPVSVGGGVLARWSPDGHTLYYRSPTHIMAARLATQGQLDVVKRDTLFADTYVKEGEGQGWDVFPNGKQFVFLKGLPAPPEKLMVVVNWQQLMKGAGGLEVAR